MKRVAEKQLVAEENVDILSSNSKKQRIEVKQEEKVKQIINDDQLVKEEDDAGTIDHD